MRLRLSWCDRMMVVASVVAAAAPSGRAEPPPASQPGTDRVIVRIGDQAVLTQANIDRTMERLNLKARQATSMEELITGLVERKWVLLYVAEHPGLVTDEEIEHEVERHIKAAKAKNLKEFEAILLKKKKTTLDEFREALVVDRTRAHLTEQGIKNARDKDLLKKAFDANPDYFDGTRVTIRHIMIHVPVFATAEQRQAAREHIARIRADLVNGKRTWEECVKESEDNTRGTNGLIGPIPRYTQYAEPIAKAAWDLNPRELSDVVESALGLHLIQAVSRAPGNRKFEDRKTQVEMSLWQERLPGDQLLEDMRAKYPPVGVYAPIDRPEWYVAPPETKPAPAMPRGTRSATRPSSPSSHAPATRPVAKPR